MVFRLIKCENAPLAVKSRQAVYDYDDDDDSDDDEGDGDDSDYENDDSDDDDNNDECDENGSAADVQKRNGIKRKIRGKEKKTPINSMQILTSMT